MTVVVDGDVDLMDEVVDGDVDLMDEVVYGDVDVDQLMVVWVVALVGGGRQCEAKQPHSLTVSQ